MGDLVPDAALPETEYRDGWLWPAYDVRGWPIIRAEAEHIGEILAHVPADRRRVAAQAGGNCGLMVRGLADAFERVVTFEPDALNYRCLQHNVPGKSVMKIRACLGERDADPVGLMGAPDNCGVRRPMTAAEQQDAGRGTVPVIALDDTALGALDLLWLDIEGYELHALRGAAETIARCKPVIVLELCHHARVYGVDDIEIVGWLAERGYVVRQRLERDAVFVWEPD